MSIAYIDIRFFAHATEDLDKVIEAVQNVLPAEYVDDIVFRRDNLQGHYGNSILLFETRIKKKEIVKAVVENFSSRLGELDKKALHEEIDLHVQKGSLYIRLDKQAALQGELKLFTTDAIRLRMRLKKAKIEDIVKTCQDLGILT
jgi:RNA binding exosome subunit